MKATRIEPGDSGAILRRVGTVLIAVGVVDIAWMVYVISSGRAYSSSFNIFAVIAGVLLRRQSLRTARIVNLFSAFLFAGFLCLFLALPFIFPVDLIQTYLRTSPALQITGWAAISVAVLGMLWWVHRSLAAPPIQAAIQSAALGPKRLWNQPRFGFALGAALVAFLAVVSHFTNRSETAHQAIERARARYGPEYRYFVSSLSTSRSSGTQTHVRATVLAYTESSVESVQLEWRQ